MASVEKREEPGRKPTWLVRWRDQQGKSHKKTFAKKSDADRFRAQIEYSLNVGTYVDPAKGKETFKSYAERWQKRQNHGVNQENNVDSHLRLILPILGNLPMAVIDVPDIEALIKSLAETRKASSVRTIMQTPRAILGSAVRDRVIPFSPMAGVKMPTMKKEIVEPLNQEQVEEIHRQMPERYRATVIAAALAGLREGEVFGLRSSDIVWRGQTAIRVVRQVQPLKGGGRGAVAPKWQKQRVVPVGETVIQCLTEHMRKYPPADDQTIFTNTQGGLLHRRVFCRTYLAARARAAQVFEGRAAQVEGGDIEQWAHLLHDAEQLGDAPFHHLRHFYASRLIEAGHNVVEVAELLGHEDPAITLRHYAHLWQKKTHSQVRVSTDSILKINLDVPQACPKE